MDTLRKKLFTLLVVLTAVAVKAGDWRLYVPFSGVEKMAETKNRVYFVSAGSLFAYDKENGETLTFSNVDLINDVDVTGIYAPLQSNRVVVTYGNGNIDIVYDNDKVVNLPDIKDARIDSKVINNVAFDADNKVMLVATSFGLVRYNLDKMEVIDSGDYKTSLSHMGFIGYMPVVFYGNHLRLLTDGASIRDINTWADLGSFGVKSLLTGAGKLYGILTEQNVPYAVLFDYDNASGKLSYRKLTANSAASMTAGNNESPAVVLTGNTLTGFDTAGSTVFSHALPADMASLPFTVTEGPRNMWFGETGGVANADITSTPIYVSEAINPGEMSVRKVQHLGFGSSGNLYMGNRGNSVIYNETSSRIIGYQSVMTPDGEFHNTTPTHLSTPWYASYQNPEGYLLDAMFMREDPDDATSYYSGNLYHGILRLSSEDGSEKVHYSADNSNLPVESGMRILDVAFDKRGFMWVVKERTKGGEAIFVLSPEGRAKGSGVTAADWDVVKSSLGFNSGRDAMLTVSANGRFVYCMGNGQLFVLDTKGTPSTSDDSGQIVSRFSMADGSGYASFSRFNRFMEDPSTGYLWICTNDGVFYIREPWDVSNGTVDIVLPKVSRNDGTGLADYLLSTQDVYGLCMDQAGHKWFTTKDSGVYLTNADGTEVLANYHSGNSPLPSNTVYAAASHPVHGDKIFFGTDYGLMEYSSGYRQGSPDYSDVRIYPNPVRPDYRGDVTIEGLMEGSRVKIVSSGGTLVAQLESEGGKLRWNPSSGSRRLPAGVYHVLASSPEGEGKPVGKIVIIR